MLTLIQFFAVSLVSSMGLLAGLALRHMAHEELEVGRFFFERAELVAVALLFIASIITGSVISALLSAVLLLFMLQRTISTVSLYLSLGAVLGISASTHNLLLVVAPLVFIVGLLHASRGRSIAWGIGALIISAHALFLVYPGTGVLMGLVQSLF